MDELPVITGCWFCGAVYVDHNPGAPCPTDGVSLVDKRQLRNSAVSQRRRYNDRAKGRVMEKVADACQAVEESMKLAARPSAWRE